MWVRVFPRKDVVRKNAKGPGKTMLMRTPKTMLTSPENRELKQATIFTTPTSTENQSIHYRWWAMATLTSCCQKRRLLRLSQKTAATQWFTMICHENALVWSIQLPERPTFWIFSGGWMPLISALAKNMALPWLRQNHRQKPMSRPSVRFLFCA
jgi:hypothetical protein